MIYYVESGSYVRDKVKVALDLSNYATTKELEHATSIGTYDLAAKNFYCFES